MSAFPRKIDVRVWSFVFGVGLGIHLAIAGLVVGGTLLGITPVAAQVQDGIEDLCMEQSECLIIKDANGGNCDAKHCWEKGHGCKSTLGYCYAKWTPIKMSVGFGTTTKVTDIGDLMVKFYDWSMGIAAILAAVMMVVGGFMYLTSFGSAGGVSKGKKYITDALIGLVLVATAYTILQTVNPDLVRFRLPKFPTIKRQAMPQCQKYGMLAPCGVKFYVKMPKGSNLQDNAKGGVGTADPKMITFENSLSDEDKEKYTLSTECLGAGCSGVSALCPDDGNKCVVQNDPNKGPEPNCRDTAPGADVGTDCTEANAAEKCDLSCEICAVPRILASNPDAKKQCIDKDPKPPCTKVVGPKTGVGKADPSGITNGRYCAFCVRNGADCKTNKNCCSGKCLSNKVVSDVCSSGEIGADCNTNDDCVTGVCNQGDFFKGKCTSGDMGAACQNDGECAKGFKCKDASCTDNGDFSACSNNGDCKSGNCDAKRKTCAPAGGLVDCSESKPCPAGQSCTRSSSADRDAAKAAAAGATAGGGAVTPDFASSFCTTGGVGTVCQADKDCGNGAACIGGICSPGTVGTICRDNNTGPRGTCKEPLFCYSSGLIDKSYCTTGLQGSPCDEDEDNCTAAFPKCERGTCQPAAQR